MNARDAILALYTRNHMPSPYQPHRTHPVKPKPQPANRQVAWYRRERAKWIAHLGGKCAVCGTTEDLEFDHDQPRDWIPNRKSRWQRMVIYIREIKEGRIKQLLCRSHNASKGYPDGQQELIALREAGRERQRTNEPF